MKPLLDTFRSNPYHSYSYAYPHKSAYRPVPRPYSLQDEWSDEKKDALSLYLHIPFCEMRCGFCNLFTTTNPKGSIEERYVEQLKMEAEVIRECLGDITIATMALGGGTPTYLQPEILSGLFSHLSSLYDARPDAIPTSVETSPGTASQEHLAMLNGWGVSRISIGVQSFIEEEVKLIGRSQRSAILLAALARIKEMQFPIFNIDLIYGIPTQTEQSWRYSLESALEYRPEELYLYPLYTRPLTGLGKSHAEPTDNRRALYDLGRELLLSNGYEQVSMRMFRRDGGIHSQGTNYCCQRDGMVGLGCGARSYTSTLHYSREYAVSSTAVKGILNQYLSTSAEELRYAEYGFRLNVNERQRRFVLQSLLQSEGLCLRQYYDHFGSDPLDDFEQLRALEGMALASREGDALILSEEGIALSDAIGPWLYSEPVQSLIESFELR